MSENENKLTVEDVRAIRNCAMRLRQLNAKHYGEPGIEVNRRVADKAEKAADKINERLAV